MERNPDSMQAFYEGREMQEIQEISEIEKELKQVLNAFEKELSDLIKRIPIDE